MPGTLTNKVILITGAGSGIGRATARRAAEEGAHVVIVDRNHVGAKETVALIRDAKGEAQAVAADVSNKAQVEAAIAFAIKTYGRLDGAFNNAAIAEPLTPILEGTDETFDRIMDINVKGVWHCMRAELTPMRAQGSGAIVNTASVAGIRGANKMAIYAASKHAVVGLTKAAAFEYARKGVRINAVCPGVIDTPMLKASVQDSERAQQGLLKGQPMGRVGQPEEIAAAVVWLLSDAASLVTGIAMPVDGGMML